MVIISCWLREVVDDGSFGEPDAKKKKAGE